MSNSFFGKYLNLAKELDSIAPKEWLPPEEGIEAKSQNIVYPALVRGTRTYIEKISNQINGCYENGWFDACAVMIRRLLETLIIEVFEKFGINDRIKNSSGDYLYLKDLINATLIETSWTLSRNSKSALPKLKEIGDKSAHSRRFNAVRNDILDLKSELRTVIQELIVLAELK